MNSDIRQIFERIEKKEITKEEGMKLIRQRNIMESKSAFWKNYVFHYNDRYLKDHTVYGKQILLGITHLSIFINYLKEVEHKPFPISLHNLQFEKPVVLNEWETVEIKTSMLEKDNVKELIDEFMTDRTDGFILSSKAVVGSTDGMELPSLSVEMKEALKHSAETSEEIYAKIAERQIVHGPSMQTMRKLYRGIDGVASSLKLTDEIIKNTNTFVVHPSLIDGAMISSTLFNQDKESTFIPFFIKNVIVYEQVPQECYAYAIPLKNNVELIMSDIYICDENGWVYMVMQGATFKRLHSAEALLSYNNEEKSEDEFFSGNKDGISITCQTIEEYVINKLQQKAPQIKTINKKRNFMELGADSMQLIALCKDIEREVQIELYPTIFFEYENIEEIAVYFENNFHEQFQKVINNAINKGYVTDNEMTETKITKTESPAEVLNDLQETAQYGDNLVYEDTDIAIIGMAGIYAESDDLDEFWDRLVSGKNLFTEIPEDHFSYKEWFDPTGKEPEKLYCKWGSFIRDVDMFDADFFHLSVREAEVMDPQLRKLLQVLYHTMENAGYADNIRGTNTGMYVGVCFHDYEHRLMDTANPYIGTGNAATMIANRPSFYFDLKGPSVSVDTACSSSLIALHIACKALNNGECDMAFASGANLLLNAWHYRYFCSIGALSYSGKSCSFDEKADGYIPGEGISSLLLKPVKKALRDGDRIHAVIKGTATNHGGYTASITAPSMKQESKVIIDAWRNAGINPETIGYIEAHGTGTHLGDPIEVNALREAFQTKGVKDGKCFLGSAKAHIGHSEGAAGITGVIKAVMSMKHEMIPVMPGFEKLNPYINLQGTPLYINTKTESWERKGKEPLRAGISAFGFGGAYAHVVVEEYKNKVALADQGEEIIFLSALSIKQLKKQAENLMNYLASDKAKDSSLIQIAYTLRLREQMDARMAFKADSKETVIKSLKAYLDGVDRKGSLFIGIREEKNTVQEYMQYTANECMRRWVEGEDIHFAETINRLDGLVDLPGYAFEKNSYWRNEIPTANLMNDADRPAENSIYYYKEYWDECEAKKTLRMKNVLLLLYATKQIPVYFTKVKEAGYQRVILIKCRDDELIMEGCHYNSRKDLIFTFKEKGINTVDVVECVGKSDQHVAFNFLIMMQSLQENHISCGQYLYIADENINHEAMAVVSAAQSLKNAGIHTSVKTVIFTECAEHNDVENFIDELEDEKSGKYIYRDGKRYRTFIEPVNVGKDDTCSLRKNGTYLITGGAGALGMIFAKYLCSHYHANVILIGRSKYDSKIQQRINETEAKNNLIYRSVDLVNQEDVNHLIQEILGIYGKLNGVLHIAGTYENTLFVNKEEDAFKNVLNPKITGTVNLSEALKDIDLDFLCFFSSVSSLLGDMGECDYSIANAFMNSYAVEREGKRKEGLCKGKTISVAWPLWKEGRMHGDAEAENRYLDITGQEFMTAEIGISVLERALADENPVLYVFTGNHEKIEMFLAEEKAWKEEKNNSEMLMPNEEINENIMKHLKEMAAGILKTDVNKFDDRHAFGDFGFESITFREYADLISEYYQLDMNPTLFFKYSKFPALANYLIKEYKEKVTGKVVNERKNDIQEKGNKELSVHKDRIEVDQIAIVGIEGKFPNCDNLTDFWDKICDQKSMITEIPKERWNWEDYYDQDNLENNKSNIKWGGFIKDYDKFDAKFFRILPKEASLMDPQQRIFMETAWKAIEDSGHKPSEYAGKRVGVFVGSQFCDYQELIMNSGVSHAQIATGTSKAMIANRVSYFLDLKGPSESIDTACSSSLIAVHHAIRAIQNDECEMALAGGVSLMLSPNVYTGIAKLGVLAPDGKCKTFDESANGYVRGEGIGVVVLKPLRKALEDHDSIYAVVRSSQVNHGGCANSLVAPNMEVQSELLLSVYHEAKVDPRRINYIEAHGTGTALGDPIEVEAINTALNKLYHEQKIEFDSNTRCGLGSVKTNIGHLEPASGIAGLIKTLLALKYNKMPGVVNLKNINHLIATESSPTYAVKKTTAWDRMTDEAGNDIPRMAGVSSFGFGGANAHILLEEYVESVRQEYQEAELIILSAKNETALKAIAEVMLDKLKWHAENVSLHDIAYTLQIGREEMEWRLAMIVSDMNDFIRKLDAFLKDEQVDAMSMNHGELKNVTYQISNLCNLHEVMDRWIEGAKIEWEHLTRRSQVRRTSLPGYPFARDRYWISTDKEKESIKVVDKAIRFKELNKDYVIYEVKENGIAVLTLNDSSNKNLLSRNMYDTLIERFQEIEKDTNIKVVVLTGIGKTFCMGGDKDTLLDISSQKNDCSEAEFIFKGLLQCRVPVISAIQGHAVGGGLTLGLSADMVVMSLDGAYGSNFAQYGFTPGVGSTYILTDKLGRVLANEMMYSARLFSGQELRDRGTGFTFANKDDVMTKAMTLADSLADKPIETLTILKSGLSERILKEMKSYVETELKMHRDLFSKINAKKIVMDKWSQKTDQNVEDLEQSNSTNKLILKKCLTETNLDETINVTYDNVLVKTSETTTLQTEKSQERSIEDKLKGILSRTIEIDENEWDDEAAFQEIGLDSISSVEFVRNINREFGLHIEAAALYDYLTIERMAGYIDKLLPKKQSGTEKAKDNMPIKNENVPDGETVAKEKIVLVKKTAEESNTKSSRKVIEQNCVIVEHIRQLVAEAIQEDVSEIEITESFKELGLDSVSIVELIRDINRTLSLKLEVVDLYNHPSVAQLAAYIEGMINMDDVYKNLVEDIQ